MPRSITKAITACFAESFPQKMGVIDFQKRASELGNQKEVREAIYIRSLHMNK